MSRRTSLDWSLPTADAISLSLFSLSIFASVRLPAPDAGPWQCGALVLSCLFPRYTFSLLSWRGLRECITWALVSDTLRLESSEPTSPSWDTGVCHLTSLSFSLQLYGGHDTYLRAPLKVKGDNVSKQPGMYYLFS